ncbi:hypothetical protein [Candidatus Endomicrobiellum trichonymphae]|uniref:hypothetical protein n=1 Tax=Endomicrobium trichonymphae TaxID=1408204 RepID=UPI0003261C8E|nr:hypothetical protein [Candidatus Endomicrobium trichonymphae]
MEKVCVVCPHTILDPCIEPARGSVYASNTEYLFVDEEFKKLVAVSYTGMIMSTRETADMKDILVSLGVTQINAESRVIPGGYEAEGTPPHSG